jgi:transposase
MLLVNMDWRSAYPAETTEAFCDGHNAAFAFFGGVPRSAVYDNTTIAAAKICGGGKRVRTTTFRSVAMSTRWSSVAQRRSSLVIGVPTRRPI